MFLLRFVISVVLIVSLLAGAFSVSYWLERTKTQPEKRAIHAVPPLVDVMTLRPQDVPEFFTGYGSARADRTATLTAEVSGAVIEVAQGLKDGSSVETGELILRIDDRTYQQQLARAEAMADEFDAQIAQLEVDRANLDKLAAIAQEEVRVNRGEEQRLLNLFEENQASKKEVDFAHLAYQRSRREWQVYANQLELIPSKRKSLLASRQARLADAGLAKLDIERCRVTSPLTGQVSAIVVDVGDHVLPGSPIATIVGTRFIEVPIELPVSARRFVDVGASCTLSMDSAPDLRWVGVLSRISPLADERSRTFSAYVDVDNESEGTPLMPGLFLTAKVAGPIHHQVLAIPRGAIIDDTVFVANDRRAHLRTVQIDRVIGERAIVVGELQPGEELITSNLDLLQDGTEVRLATMDSDPVDRSTMAERQAPVQRKGGS